MIQRFIESLIAATICTSVLLFTVHLSTAQVRSSSNYELQSDSINIGGGLSSSTNYVQENTVGEVATGFSSSTSYSLYAGYQQMQSIYLSMTAPADVVMDPALPGLTGGTSNGSTTVTVTTDNPAGYSLTIVSENDPAMNSDTESIPDYPAGSTPDFSFTFSSTDAFFGYTAEGQDIRSIFKDNGALCNVGTQDTVDSCWRGLSTSDVVVAQASGSNHPDGVKTILKFRVGIGGNASVISGVYTATTTLTALPL